MIEFILGYITFKVDLNNHKYILHHNAQILRNPSTKEGCPKISRTIGVASKQRRRCILSNDT